MSIRHSAPNDSEVLKATVRALADDPDMYAIVSTGGTGLTQRDVAPEATAVLFGRPVRGFGELFRVLSYDKIGSSTIASRAVANGTIVLNLPASPSTCRMAMDKIILNQLDSRPKP